MDRGQWRGSEQGSSIEGGADVVGVVALRILSTEDGQVYSDFKLVEGKHSRTAGTIQQTVTSLDGLVNGVGAGGVVNLPEAEADLGHLVAAAELDGGDISHFGGL